MIKNKKIGIDARFYGPHGKGLGRYAQEVIDRVLLKDQVNDYVIFLARENFEYFKTDNPRVKKVLMLARWYTLREQLLFPWMIWREKIDLMHFLHFNVPVFCPTKLLVTIHDLILINFPTQRATTLGPVKYFLKNLGYRVVIRLAILRAEKVIAVSQFTKDDIVKTFKVNPEKVVVTYEGVATQVVPSSEDKKNDQEILTKFNINRPYILYAGNAYPHKNLDGLIDCFAKLKNDYPELRLVLVGKEDYFYKQIKEHAVKNKLYSGEANDAIVFTGHVSDVELAKLFRNALVYVFASYFEGFGLPPLEAMANGLPVVSSNRTCMPEVLGGAAEYFDPGNPEDFYEKLKSVISNEPLRKEMIAAGYEQIKKYSWEKCADETLELYK